MGLSTLFTPGQERWADAVRRDRRRMYSVMAIGCLIGIGLMASESFHLIQGIVGKIAFFAGAFVVALMSVPAIYDFARFWNTKYCCNCGDLVTISPNQLWEKCPSCNLIIEPRRYLSHEPGELDLTQESSSRRIHPYQGLLGAVIDLGVYHRCDEARFDLFENRMTYVLCRDGICEAMEPPPEGWRGLDFAQAAKCLAQMNELNRDEPQQGSLLVHLPDRDITVEILTEPIEGGERLLIRFPEPSHKLSVVHS